MTTKAARITLTSGLESADPLLFCRRVTANVKNTPYRFHSAEYSNAVDLHQVSDRLTHALSRADYFAACTDIVFVEFCLFAPITGAVAEVEIENTV